MNVYFNAQTWIAELFGGIYVFFFFFTYPYRICSPLSFHLLKYLVKKRESVISEMEDYHASYRQIIMAVSNLPVHVSQASLQGSDVFPTFIQLLFLAGSVYYMESFFTYLLSIALTFLSFPFIKLYMVWYQIPLLPSDSGKTKLMLWPSKVLIPKSLFSVVHNG